MQDKMQELRSKLQEYSEYKSLNLGVNWELIKEIICIIGDLFSVISDNLPDKYKWMGTMFSTVSNILKLICQSLPESDKK